MFEFDADAGRFVALHHPFTAPRPDQVEDLDHPDALLADPGEGAVAPGRVDPLAPGHEAAVVGVVAGEAPGDQLLGRREAVEAALGQGLPDVVQGVQGRDGLGAAASEPEHGVAAVVLGAGVLRVQAGHVLDVVALADAEALEEGQLVDRPGPEQRHGERGQQAGRPSGSTGAGARSRGDRMRRHGTARGRRGGSCSGGRTARLD